MELAGAGRAGVLEAAEFLHAQFEFVALLFKGDEAADVAEVLNDAQLAGRARVRLHDVGRGVATLGGRQGKAIASIAWLDPDGLRLLRKFGVLVAQDEAGIGMNLDANQAPFVGDAAQNFLEVVLEIVGGNLRELVVGVGDLVEELMVGKQKLDEFFGAVVQGRHFDRLVAGAFGKVAEEEPNEVAPEVLVAVAEDDEGVALVETLIVDSFAHFASSLVWITDDCFIAKELFLFHSRSSSFVGTKQ